MDQTTVLTQKQQNDIHEYRMLLEKAGIPVERMILFGSAAKKQTHPWSDLDICVVSRMFGKEPLDESVLLTRLARKVNDVIEPHPYHPNDLTNKYDSLAYEIRTHGVYVA